MALHPVGVPKYKRNTNNCKNNPTQEAIFESGENGKVRYALGNANGEGVEHGSGKAYMRCHIAHANTNDGIITH